MFFFWLTCFRPRSRVTELHGFLRVVRKSSCIWFSTQQLGNSVIMTVSFKLKFIIRKDKKLQEREGKIFVWHMIKEKNHWNVHTASYLTHKKSHRMLCSMLTKPHQTLKAVPKAGKFKPRTPRMWATSYLSKYSLQDQGQGHARGQML